MFFCCILGPCVFVDTPALFFKIPFSLSVTKDFHFHGNRGQFYGNSCYCLCEIQVV